MPHAELYLFRFPCRISCSDQVASYYTRDEFLELEPVIVTSLEQLLRTYLKVCFAKHDEV